MKGSHSCADSMPPSAAETAIVTALARQHGVYKLNVKAVVEPLAAYYVGRGESLADIPLDVPSVNKADHERRWRARLTAAGVADAGDCEDFLLWMDARSAPVGSGGAGAASGLAKVALVALEAAGDRPSAAGMTSLEKALALGESGDEEAQCCCALVAFLLIWGRDPFPNEEVEWDRQHASLGGRPGGKIDITSDEKYGKLQKSSELVGRITLRRALRSADHHMFEEWLTDMTDMLHAKNKPKAAARLAKVVSHARRQAYHVWEAIREGILGGLLLQRILGLGTTCSYSAGECACVLGLPCRVFCTVEVAAR